MLIIFTCDDGNGGELKRSYPDPSLKLCINLCDNMFAEKRVDAVQVGDLVCHYPGKPDIGREVTLIEVV